MMWMDRVLGELWQTQKTTHILYDSTYNEASRKGKSTETIDRLMATKDGGEGKSGERLLNGSLLWE